MNRPIRFRAWHAGKNLWVHDSKGIAGGCNILGEVILLGGWMSEVSITELNDIVVEQFTGVLDRDGREIYEGDIIEWSHLSGPDKRPVEQAAPASVTYSDHYAAFILFTKSLIFLHQAWAPKVVGNRWEDAHLLRP